MKSFLLACAGMAIAGIAAAQAIGVAPTTIPDPTPFQLVSIDLTDGAMMPDLYVNNAYGCEGANDAPTLSWTYPPEGTKSFAVTMFDVHARDGDGWLHWAVLNIPPRENILPRGAGKENKPLPEGATVIPNSWGNAQYDGPCPPVGDKPHKYVFTVYAMPDDNIQYPLNALGWMTIDWLSDRALAKASVTTVYQRLP